MTRQAGWKMSKAQAWMFWKMWGNACKCQGWDKWPVAQRDVKRAEVLAELGFTSVKEVDHTSGFDRVKLKLLELADKVIIHTPETGQPTAPGEDAGDRRRLYYRVGEIIAELTAAGYDEGKLNKILHDFGVMKGLSGIVDLSNDRLLTLSRTLTARLKDAQDTVTASQTASPMEQKDLNILIAEGNYSGAIGGMWS